MAIKKNVLTLAEAARYLQVHPITMYRLVQAGKLPGAFKMGRVWRINREGLEQLAAGARDEIDRSPPLPN